MGIFSKLFSSRSSAEPKTAGEAPEVLLRRYIDTSLPKSYTSSPKYAVDIQPNGGRYAVRLTLDMTADGSDYSDFQLQDYLNISELEGGYLLEGCLSSPPFPTDFSLNLLFDERGMTLLREFYANQA